MDPLSTQSAIDPRPFVVRKTRTNNRAVALAAPVVLLVLTAGCVGTGSFLNSASEKPTGNVCQVLVTWNPEVVFTPDPTHGGTPAPGIAGRLYLFGSEIDRPLTGDGCVVVDLYDDTPSVNGKASVPLEEWRIDKATLKRLERRDAVGWGYTLFLPWGTYRPEITQVQLRLRYEPATGTPLYAESSPVVFNKGSVPAPQVASRLPKPGG
jgi:hypothetical protein